MLNPIAPPGIYIADPEARQMPNGKIYVYGSRDVPGTAWCSTAYHVLSSYDLKHWDLDQFSFATQGKGKQTDYTDDILYAPDCIYHNGKYYLYYCLASGGENEGVAVSESPYGPFRNGQPIKGITGIDPSVFIDDDGQAYLYWGQGHARGAKLSKDMRSIEGEVHDNLLTYQEHYFNEGSSVRKINGTYYYVYGSHSQHGESNCATLDYATGSTPFGPFTYRGVIIDNYESNRNVVNNHGSLLEVDGQWYIFYHRPTHDGSTMRKVCLEPIFFNPDGSIRQAEMTTQGAGGPISPLLRMDAARACRLKGNITVRVYRPAQDTPVEYLSDIRNGDCAWWKYYDFDRVQVTRFLCKTWGENRAARIEVRLDSPNGLLLGTCELSPSKGETAYRIHSIPIKPASGRHALVLVFRGDPGVDLMNLEWLTFE